MLVGMCVCTCCVVLFFVDSVVVSVMVVLSCIM